MKRDCACEGRGGFGGAIGAAVIDDHELKGAEFAGDAGEPLEQCGHAVFVPVTRDDDAHVDRAIATPELGTGFI